MVTRAAKRLRASSGGGCEFFRGETPFDVEESNRVGVTEDGGAEAQEGFVEDEGGDEGFVGEVDL